MHVVVNTVEGYTTKNQFRGQKHRFPMPIQAPLWTEFLFCPICTLEFAANLRQPISLGCGHSICKNCLSTLHRKQCPFDQTTITKDLENLPINYALLQLVTPQSNINNNNHVFESEIQESIVQSLSSEDLQCYKLAKRCIEELALYLKPNGNVPGLLSRPMQRKLVTLVNCQLMEDEGRERSQRAARSLGERTVTELILQHQNPQQLSTNLWAAVRARGCQFLGPAMQEEVLKLVLLALEDGTALSRKVLVMFVVQRLEPHFPQASKTSIGHVVQLLYRASCFKVSKRDGDSSLMQLKEEFRTYDALRREHDAQIVQIATEAGLRISPDQWSSLLYGDSNHKSHMQSIIDKLQTPQSFSSSVGELVMALQRTGDPAKLSTLRVHLKNLAAIDPTSENTVPTWNECAEALDAVKQVVNGLVDFVQHHSNRKLQDTTHQLHSTKYKISFCRDLSVRGSCPRGPNCTFAHSEEELERYRAKLKKSHNMRPPPISHLKDMPYVENNGPTVTVNNSSGHSFNNDGVSQRFNQKDHHPHHQQQPHVIPSLPNKSNPYPISATNSSTPNLSPQQMAVPPPIVNNNRFMFNNTDNGYNTLNYSNPPHHSPQMQNILPPMMGNGGNNNNINNNNNNGMRSFRPPPLTQMQMKHSPGGGYSPDMYSKKSYSPYNMLPPSPGANKMQGNSQYPHHHPSRDNNDYSNNNDMKNNDMNRQFINWSHEQQQMKQQQNYTLNRNNNSNNNCDNIKPNMQSMGAGIKSPNTLMPRSPMTGGSIHSQHTSPTNRSNDNNMALNRVAGMNGSSVYTQRNKNDETDGMSNIMWNYPSQPTPPVYHIDTSQSAKDNFTRSDSILTSSATDDDFTMFESLSSTGKYGPIGIKTSPNVMETIKARSQLRGPEVNVNTPVKGTNWSNLQTIQQEHNIDVGGGGGGGDSMKQQNQFDFNNVDLSMELTRLETKFSNMSPITIGNQQRQRISSNQANNKHSNNNVNGKQQHNNSNLFNLSVGDISLASNSSLDYSLNNNSPNKATKTAQNVSGTSSLGAEYWDNEFHNNKMWNGSNNNNNSIKKSNDEFDIVNGMCELKLLELIDERENHWPHNE